MGKNQCVSADAVSCTGADLSGAHDSRKCINIPPAPMTAIVVIFKSHACTECCVTVDNHTDAKSQLLTAWWKIEHDFNYKQDNNGFQQ